MSFFKHPRYNRYLLYIHITHHTMGEAKKDEMTSRREMYTHGWFLTNRVERPLGGHLSIKNISKMLNRYKFIAHYPSLAQYPSSIQYPSFKMQIS